MNWKENRKDLGTVKEGSTVKFIFEANKDLEIDKVKPSCGGCTTANYIDGILNVTFRARKIPKHIRTMKEFKFQTVTKTIVVTYKDGVQEVLKFNVKIIK